jgi:hypothetical protein
MLKSILAVAGAIDRPPLAPTPDDSSSIKALIAAGLLPLAWFGANKLAKRRDCSNTDSRGPG